LQGVNHALHKHSRGRRRSARGVRRWQRVETITC
jgi:hypothetical protein